MVRAGGPPRVFVSYSHDSPEHVQHIRALADRLRSEGIDCHIDQYEMFPPEGWPTWMLNQIGDSDFVLVVSSEPYLKRVTGKELPGRGAGAKWEGAIITQALYDTEGRNHKFIPVLLNATDVRFVPPFLAPFTRYDISTPIGYDSLYRLLTQQPSVEKPPLGELRELPPADSGVGSGSRKSDESQRDAEDLASTVLIFGQEIGMQLVKADEITIGEEIRLVVAPFNPEGAAFLSSLQKRGKPIAISYNLSALTARVTSITKNVRTGRETYDLRLKAEESDYGAGIMEMSVQGFSADKIAELRARRILLDEKLSAKPDGQIGRLNADMMEAFVGGMNTQLAVKSSPLPGLFQEIGSNTDFFLVTARLLAILWLRLSGTVETVLRLQLILHHESILTVDFVGLRAKKYINAEAVRITVQGECRLA